MSGSTTVTDIVSKADSDGGKLILLYLSRVQQAAVREIAQTLDISLAQTYGTMKQLKSCGAVQNVEGTVYEIAR